MAKDKFCSADDLSVIVPYKDFEKLVGFANNYAGLEARLKKTEAQLDALRSMYFELLDKIAEINRYL